MYVDGFVLPVPTRNVKQYLGVSRKAGKVWKKYGALEYREASGDDLRVDPKMGQGMKKAAKAKAGETVFFSWILYKSRTHRDAVNRRVMKDPGMLRMMQDSRNMPFDVKRMAYGGFKIRVDL